MSQVETALDSHVVAVYPNHSSAEEAVRRLVKEGIADEGRVHCGARLPGGGGADRVRQRVATSWCDGCGDRGVGRRAVRTADRGGVPGPAGRGPGDHRRARYRRHCWAGWKGALAGRGAVVRCPGPWSAWGIPEGAGASEATRPRSRRDSIAVAATPSRSRRTCPRGED